MQPRRNPSKGQESFLADVRIGVVSRPSFIRHPGEGRDLTLTVDRTGEIPAFAGMTIELRAAAGRKRPMT
ncbi:MAG: hypothetical protein RIA72_02465 [Sphingopyxis sp.]|uniref:hypothetical protein n=1 Tax=Sphingopyxis sp. TaxID=1908224 RepID=UPI0032EB9B75